jgi:hypothetical protein
MRIEKQHFTLNVENYDFSIKKFNKHGQLFSGDCKRALVVGSSGSGKTNLLISLLENPNGLRFENVYVYSKSLNQPKYQYLRQLLKPMKEIGYSESDTEENIVEPSNIKPNAVIIFDDIVCCNQSIIRDYFCFGRHKYTDCFYLCQTYSSIPKQLIRDNANLLIIFKQDQTNLKHIYDDHINVDMNFQMFKELCSTCWNDKYGFLVVDKDCNLNSGRYRKGFDSFIYI